MKILVLSHSLLLLWIQDVSSKPVPGVETRQEEWSEEASQYDLRRVRRSIPDFDAVNPAYDDVEALPDQEEAMDPQKVISPFALTDHLANFFRGTKTAKNEPKTPQKTGQGERVSSLREEEAGVNGGLSSDEQEECYRQQNLEPPVRMDNLEKTLSKMNFLGEMPIIDVAQMAQPSYVRRGHEKSGISSKLKVDDKGEVFSLYSNLEKTDTGKKGSVLKPNTSDEFKKPESVYKPVGVEAHFPVYDEDIDFHPDPLQGILDDKYWMDPQQQEAVIRKYIDLAANNMMPPDLQVMKRSALRNPGEVKSVKSQLGVKDPSADGKCPCNEVVVACKDCSKGKASKKNDTYSMESSDNDGEVSFGRKLLWKNDDNDEMVRKSFSQHDSEMDCIWEENKEGLKFGDNIPRHYNRKLLSAEIGDIGHDEDEMGEDKGAFIGKSDENIKIGRKILWYYEEDEESYEDEEDDQHEFSERESKNFKENVPTFESNESEHSLQTHVSEEQVMVGDSDLAFKSNNLRNNVLVDIVEKKNPMFDLANKPPGFFRPNKMANVLQRPKQRKPKKEKDEEDQIIDPQREFEMVRNETFHNASRESAYEDTTKHAKSHNEKKEKFRFSSKGRRSYPEIFIENRPPVVPLFQTGDDTGGSGKVDENKTSNSLQTFLSSTPQTNVTINATVENQNTTTEELNVTTTTAKMKSTSPKFGSDEEEALDSKVASNIVESVISESEKSSVLGHNLGLCRRNESLGVNFDRVVPETEKIFKLVSDCVMQKMKDHLEKKSCTLLDPELLGFLKWMILSGESFRDYKQKMKKYYEYVPPPHNVTTAAPMAAPATVAESLCEPDQSFVSNISIADIQ